MHELLLLLELVFVLLSRHLMSSLFLLMKEVEVLLKVLIY